MSLQSAAIDAGQQVLKGAIQIPLASASANASLSSDKATFGEFWAFDFAITDILLTLQSPPVGSALTVDVKKNGVSIFNTLISVDGGQKTSSNSITPHRLKQYPTLFERGCWVTVSVTQVGAVLPGSYPVLTLFGTRRENTGDLQFGGDPDILNYLAAVEAADGQQLEPTTRRAIAQFIRGCKRDGIWDAIKSACLLCAARTLAGALVPLKGIAPTNEGFIGADYNRKTGLKGNGSSKRLNTNRTAEATLQRHCYIWLSEPDTKIGQQSRIIGSSVNPGGVSVIINTSDAFVSATFSVGTPRSGVSRAGAVVTAAQLNYPSDLPGVFSITNSFANASDARATFYSFGENINLSLLDSRVATLLTAIGGAF